MLNWIKCATRPLSANEIREAIAFTINDLHWDSAKIPNDIGRLVRACGNLVVIDEHTLIVSFAHYTVQQYLMGQDGPSSSYFRIQTAEAENQIGQLCVAYLSFSDFETQLTRRSDMANPTFKALGNALQSQRLLPSNSPAAYAAKTLAKIRRSQPPSSAIDFSRHVMLHKGGLSSKRLMDKYVLLDYIIKNWLHHTRELARPTTDKVEGNERYFRLFDALAFERNLLFEFRPWKDIRNDGKFFYIGAVGWAIFSRHIPLLQAIDRQAPVHEQFQNTLFYLTEAREFYSKEQDVKNLTINDVISSCSRQRSYHSNS